MEKRADLERGASEGERLSKETIELAARYLSGEIGRAMPKVKLDVPDEAYLEMPSKERLYAEAVRQIALKAPLRIIPGERLAGAATLKEAMQHIVPGLRCGSISHTTIGFEKALAIGYKGIRLEIEGRLERGGLDGTGVELLNAMLSCLDSAKIWHGRYAEELARLGMDEVLASFRSVPENPPESFREAVQALWLLWDFQRLCGNWSGIGRIDKMLGPYLKRDLASRAIGLDEARELIAHFWIKGCEWITAQGCGSGDAQFYQNIILAGADEAGEEVANEVTELVLDVVEELHISDFPIAVRISSKTSERLLRRIAAVQRLGGGIVAVYNEDRIIPSLVKFGYPLEEARNFANDGCWEILIPGKTCFGYLPFDALQVLQDALGLNNASQKGDSTLSILPDGRKEFIDLRHGDGETKKEEGFEAVYGNFKRRLAFKLAWLVNDLLPASTQPTVLIDMLVEGCVEKGRSYLNLGPKYTVRSPHAGGLPDVANSLLAIRRLVYEERKFTLPELLEVLRNDWQGHEETRKRVRESFDFYGNDSKEADAMLGRVFDDYTELVAKVRTRNGVLFPAGISTFGREASAFLPDRLATAAGSKKGDILALNFSPSPGTDRRGPTAVIKSHCSVDFSKLPCGTALELKMAPSSLKGEGGLAALTGLLKAFVSLGGIFMQIDAVDAATLRDAQEHPERHPNLAVRISGWSARFATLSRQWQEMVIARSEQRL